MTFASEDGSTLEMEDSDSAEIGILRVSGLYSWGPSGTIHTIKPNRIKNWVKDPASFYAKPL